MNDLSSYHIADTFQKREYYYTHEGTWTLDKGNRALYSYRDALGSAGQVVGPSQRKPRIVAEE